MSRPSLRSTAVVGLNTALSRALGFVRDMIIARVFGVSGGTDAFFVAFRIPNLARRLFAEGAFSAAFVPVLTEYKAQRTEAEVRELARRTAGTLAGVLFVVTVLGVLAAPLLVYVFAPGFAEKPDQFNLTVDLLRICFPYLLFIALTALCGAALNVYGRFGVPAFTPVWLNVALIVAALWLAPQFEQPVTALAIGVFMAGIAQLAFQLPALRTAGLLAWPRWSWHDSGVRRIARLMLPALLGSSVAQINALVGTLVASFLAAGSVSWLYYADRLVEFPLGIFGIALSTVILPHLSRQHAEQSHDGFSATLDWSLRVTLIVALPAMLGLALLAEPILATLFQYGEFTQHDVRMTALSLICYAVGLPGFILIKILAPGFYARHDTATPVRIGMIAIAANIVLMLAFTLPLHIGKVPGEHAGLALATALSAWLNAGLLLVHLRRARAYRPAPGWARVMVQLGVANAALIALLWWGLPVAEQWSAWSVGTRGLTLALWIAVAVGVYFAALRLAGLNFVRLIRAHH